LYLRPPQIPQHTSFYTLHITSQILDAHNIYKLVAAACPSLNVRYSFFQETPYQLFEAFHGRHFHSLTYGLLAALWFDQFETFHVCLQTLIPVLKEFRAPILPHLNPTYQAPIINIGKTRLNDVGEYVEDTSPDPQLDALVAHLNTYAEPQVSYHYTLSHVITTRARGSMFMMHHTELDLPCVVKEARVGYDPTLDGHDAATRCLREAQTLAHLEPLPFIPPVVDHWQTSFATFLATPWLGDQHLGTFLKKAPLGQRFSALKDLLSALTQLHQAGWVWLDVKPSNVLQDTDGRWWLIDLETATRNTPQDFSPLLWASSHYWPPNHTALLTPQHAHRLDHFAFWVIVLLATDQVTTPTDDGTPDETRTTTPRDAYSHFSWPTSLPGAYTLVADLLNVLADPTQDVSPEAAAQRSRRLLATLHRQVANGTPATVVLN
jgi:serine/threonine protein kinase